MHTGCIPGKIPEIGGGLPETNALLQDVRWQRTFRIPPPLVHGTNPASAPTIFSAANGSSTSASTRPAVAAKNVQKTFFT